MDDKRGQDSRWAQLINAARGEEEEEEAQEEEDDMLLMAEARLEGKVHTIETAESES
jgi:hypothetical protein